MAQSATLAITHQLAITVGTDEYKLDASSTVSGIGNAVKRQVTCLTASETTILGVGAAIALGTLSDISFLVIQNVDPTNFCRVRIADTGGMTYDVKIPAGLYHVLWNKNLSVSATEQAFAAYADLNTVSVQFDTADGEVIVFAGEPC